MKGIIAKILKIFLYLAFALIFVFLVLQLFFKQEFYNIFSAISQKSQVTKVGELLTVVYFNEATSLEPAMQISNNREKVVNIYEPLVKPDRDLKMKSALALSWGLIDDLTWEFNLRPDVLFHDGSLFDANDALVSINRALTLPGSDLSDFLSVIDNVEIIDDMTIRVHTKKPDPLLLNKLSTVLMMPSEYEGKEILNPVGTGPYIFQEWQKDKEMIVLAFDKYWGDAPHFKKVKLIPMIDKNDRVALLVNGEADLLTYVPFDAIEYLVQEKMNIEPIPSLEVAFMAYNVSSKAMSGVNFRKALSLALDVKSFLELLGNYARPVSQFVSNGVFGFNPNIPEHEYDLEMAKKLIDEGSFDGRTIVFALPKELEMLGEFVRTSLEKVDISAIISYVDYDEYFAELKSGKSDIYFLGFKGDLGDSGDFFNQFVASSAELNLTGYKNPRVDDLIEASLVELNLEKRRNYLQEIMKIIVEDDVLGLPLYEYETIYAFNHKIDYQPRIDGFVYFDDVIPK
ncbi:hypothetical protein HY604_04885 [Candidatus Peregrinibacteria bacterium]|nr:hypothetical protein [Candidatus Peregrinibacteria bacterium]